MSDPPDLKLNGPSRFEKQSRLVLEEHSSCEVPAGCGGIVLRWRDPAKATPLTLWLAASVPYDLFLDGVEPPSSRPLVPHGEHVLAFRFHEGPVTFLFAAIYDESPANHRGPRLSRPTGQRFALLTAADGTWRHVLAPPAADWNRPGLDDSTWPPLGARDEPDPGEDHRLEWQVRHARELGARAIGTAHGGPVWVRRRFKLEAP